ncbi:hypothetical protein E4P35_14330 [Thiopseudomonas sp. 4R-3cl]|nr:hypothetical protein E4P35_14330 [Thiopseudomonas sp. 4R-3cl]
MNTTQLQRVRRAHPALPGVPVSTTRHNRRAWVRSVRMLGDKWLLATPINASADEAAAMRQIEADQQAVGYAPEPVPAPDFNTLPF